MKKPIWIVAVVVALLIVAKIAIGIAEPKDERQLIVEALGRSIQASKEGRPGGVLQLLSDHLTFNNQDESSSLGQVAKFIRDRKPDIRVEQNDPVVTGDTAQITSPVDIDLSFLGQSKTYRLKNVVLIFRKESAMSMLIIPTKEWRLTDVQAPSDVADQLAE